MAPPAFSDLGKAARDVFNKGYYLNVFRVDAKTKTKSNIDLKASLSSNRDSGKMSGSLESKYKWSDYGLTFTEKWTTENVLYAEIKIEDQFAEGLELGLDVSLSPQTGKRSTSIKSAYKWNCLHLCGGIDCDLAGPVLHGAAVLGTEGWLAGYQLSFDTSKSKLTSSNFGFGYAAGDFSFTTIVNNAWANINNDGQEFTGAIHHRVNDKLEAAVNLAWAAGTGNTKFAIGGRYKLDNDVSFSTKLDNQSNLGLSYTQALRNDVKFTISCLIDGKSINQGGHKVGIGIEFEA